MSEKITPRIPKELETPESFLRTPRITSTPRIDGESRTCIISFIENSTREVGAAVLRLHPPILTLHQFTDTSLYSHSKHLIEVQQPAHIVIPGNTANKSPLSQLLKEDKENLTGITITEVIRSTFSDNLGREILSELSNKEIEDSLYTRYLSLSAAAACILFAKSSYKFNIRPSSLKVEFHQLEGRLLVDPLTLTQFSILSTSQKNSLISLSTSKKKICPPTLFNLLDRCFTNSGSRFLRSTIASPPSKINVIKERQEFVSEIVNTPSIYRNLISIFSKIMDIDPVITFLVTNDENKINFCLPAIDSLQNLLFNIKHIHRLCDELSKMDSHLSQVLSQNILQSSFFKINDIIATYLNADPNINDNKIAKNEFSTQIYAIKTGVMGILDATRKCYEDTISEIYTYAKDLSKKYNIKINIKYNKKRRYFLNISKSNLKKNNESNNMLPSVKNAVDNTTISTSSYIIPSELIHVSENTGYINATTFDLLLLNKKNQTAQEDTIALTQNFIESKINDIRPFIKDIYQVSETIGFIDSLLSFAIVAHEYENYRAPKIKSFKIFALRSARHPIMENIISTKFAETISAISSSNTIVTSPSSPSKSKRNKYITNNLDLTTTKPVMILRGANMSGKTTYLQMAIQIAIMAQCGSFVPCDKCVLSPFTSIFTRSGTNDSIEGNASAFFLEMKEMSHITTHADSNSLIAIDEPCISTSVRDGIGLSFACIERLITANSFVLCSTHFPELELLSNLYPSVSLKEMKTRKNSNGEYEFLYYLSDESSIASGYGIDISSQYYPPKLIKHARKAFEILNQQNNNKKKSVKKGKMASGAILQQLLSLKFSTLSDEGLKMCILNIRKRCRSTP